jgi:lipoate-protein ligase A
MRDVSTPLDMTRRSFNALRVYHDFTLRSAAMNMAIDEALLETAKTGSIRFYRWQSPALSFGYFGKFKDVANYAAERDLVRRWTGGGVVFHGHDLTYAIVIPPSDPVFSESSRSIYGAIHAALRDALVASGERAELAPVTGIVNPRAATIDRGYSCFANPVRADVMLNGRKVAGAAQRRTRRGLLQQGSIQYVDLGNGLSERFAQALSANCSEREINCETLDRARELAEQKYGAGAWLRKR